MKVKVLYFPNNQYFHVCTRVYAGIDYSTAGEPSQYFRDSDNKNHLSIFCTGVTNTHIVVDPDMYNFLMDKFGTLEGTFAEWEL